MIEFYTYREGRAPAGWDGKPFEAELIPAWGWNEEKVRPIVKDRLIYMRDLQQVPAVQDPSEQAPEDLASRAVYSVVA